MIPGGRTCTVAPPTRHRLSQDKAQERKDLAELKADEFNLQVAEDQLNRDESGN